MGSLALQDFIEHADSEKQALIWHLSSNCYPSIYSEHVVDSCRKALKHARNGDWQKLVRWTEPGFQPKRNIETKNHRLYVKTHELIRICHLDNFLQQEEE